MYNLKYRDKYGEMILACDSRSWRKDVYPQYKAARKKNRESGSSGVNWKEAFEIMNAVRSDIKEYFPYKVIASENAEADDIIAAIVEDTQEFGRHERVMICSADKDFIQLQQYLNVSQFSPMTKKFVKDDKPLQYLFEHICRGDSGDGIPNILSDDDTFVNGIRQTPLKSKLIDELAVHQKNGTLQERLEALGLWKNYTRNNTLINLSQTPKHIKDDIINQYTNYKKVDNSKVLNYLIQKRCNLLISCANEFF
jgi:hypothetical protein